MKALAIAAAVGLSLCAATIACRRAPSPTVFIDPALAVLIPPETKLLIGVRMQNLRANPKIDAMLKDAPRLIRFRKDTGLPPESDIWEYLITYNGSTWLALMRGKFTEMGMEPRFDKPGASRLNHDGVTVLGDERGAVAFLNPTTAIAGNLENVIRTLDLRNGNTGVPAAIEKLTGQISSNYDIWFAGVGIAPEVVQASGIRTARGGVSLASDRYDLVVDAERGEVKYKDAPIPNEIVQWILGTAP